MTLGLALGVSLYAPLSEARVGGLSLRFDLGTVLSWSAALLVLGQSRGQLRHRHHRLHPLLSP
jgi:hypothetical protein